MTGTRLLSTAAFLICAAAPSLAQTSTYPSATMPGGTVAAPAPAAPAAGVVVAPPGSVVVTQPAQIGSGTSVPGSLFGVTTDCASVSGATSGGPRGTTTALDCRRLGTSGR